MSCQWYMSMVKYKCTSSTVENEDFTSVLVGTEVQNNGGVQVRELQDYALTVDMAKHVCLMSR